jgi:hypothetical protein
MFFIAVGKLFERGRPPKGRPGPAGQAPPPRLPEAGH